MMLSWKIVSISRNARSPIGCDRSKTISAPKAASLFRTGIGMPGQGVVSDLQHYNEAGKPARRPQLRQWLSSRYQRAADASGTRKREPAAASAVSMRQGWNGEIDEINYHRGGAANHGLDILSGSGRGGGLPQGR